MSGNVVIASPRLERGASLSEAVASLSESSEDSVIPNEETWCICSFTGAAAYLDDTTSSLVWDYGGDDEEILVMTHGDTTAVLERHLVGDGVKKLSVVLTNDTNSGHVLGGSWRGF